MFPIFQTTFLCGPALLYFMDIVMNDAKSPRGATTVLNDHFLDDKAKIVNEDYGWSLHSRFLISCERHDMKR